MTDPEPRSDGEGEASAPLRRRPPRSLAVHAAADAGIVFLVAVLPALFLGAPFWAIVVGAILGGLPAAPFTRRAEARALAARPE